MLSRKSPHPPKLTTYGFLVGVEIEEGTASTEEACGKIADALRWVDGIGAVEVECLGEITRYEDEADA